MFGIFKKKKENPVLKEMDGREIKYVTRRQTDQDGNVKEVIMGKSGRIVCIDGEIRVMCGETDVFRCSEHQADYYRLLSGNGITVSGINSISGQKEDIVVYYTYYRS